ncbi:HWE histidine kinase domain-containing protein [uncultured Erythrobacter sp.]|uniref:HWE histidine kinase domain-containing protein n=1 Tax=uncultured Erythrobacter sp. TaxID=263913 RepID=UPI002622F3BB|nr:HWE histidine kinase domain-containing protein [uncultured Erythrobacter sp.]
MNFLYAGQDQTECDREAIHLISAIQGFGALIAVNANWTITHRSANCSTVLGTGDAFEIGQPLDLNFTRNAMMALKAAFDQIVKEDSVERLFGLDLLGNGALFDCAIHPSGGKIIIEFEPHDTAAFQNHLAGVTPAIGGLSTAQSTDELCSMAAKVLRDLLGYDRVMIYRFRRDQSGEVIAEEKRDDLVSYLGLRYPKTDIPQQARRLFVRNRFRIIADTQAEAVPIEAAPDEQNAPLDLSMSVLRSLSPVHVQYMKNMGVRASLSIAIVRRSQLWGLISCHHDTPRTVPYSLRSIAEMLSHVFSMTLDRILIERTEKLRIRSQGLHDQMLRRLAEGISFVDDLEMFAGALGELIPHDGASVLIGEGYHSTGDCPDRDQFAALLPSLCSSPDSAVLAARSLSDHISEAAEFSDKVAGALILSISRSANDYLVLWRKPLTQTDYWAGNPAKAMIEGRDQLEPRTSFSAWAETVEGLSAEWSDDELMIANNLRATLMEIVLRMNDEVAIELKRAREQQDLLIAELNHRVRNILNLVRSLVSQSGKDAINIADFSENIDGRIAALAIAHDNITRQNWTPAPLHSLIESEIAAYVSSKKDRLTMVGDPVLIEPEAYTVLALVVHELVTNSVKYGSLCDDKGTIEVKVSLAINGDLLIDWIERGGPPVKPPTRQGFGTTIITRLIPHDLQGEAESDFKDSGLEAKFRVPARFIASQGEVDAPLNHQAAPEIGFKSKAKDGQVPEHVLLVEDNMIIAHDTEGSLREAGVKSVTLESTVGGALAAIEKREPDFAIVDFNLRTESSIKVAEELARRGVRFVLATGYSELGNEAEELGAEAIIRKPYGMDEIVRALKGELLGERAG